MKTGFSVLAKRRRAAGVVRRQPFAECNDNYNGRISLAERMSAALIIKLLSGRNWG
jgi:hypothetical protein